MGSILMRPVRRTIILAAAITAGATGPAMAEAPTAATFEEIVPCPFETPEDFESSRLRCGYLTVPENRTVADSASIRIPLAIIRTRAERPRGDPVVFLHGGPGGAPLSASASLELFGGHRFGANRDIILYNQRGSLMVEPALDCDAISDRRLAPYAENLTLEERDARIAGMVIECLGALVEQGRDLAGYSAVENAHDLRDLRRLLEIDQWNLMAVSYGTYMAVEAARLDPEGVRAMVLDSLVSPESDLFLSEANRNFSLGMDRLIAACADAEACNAAFPDLAGQLANLLERLAAEPAAITISGTEPTQPISVAVNWHDFLNLTHWMLYNQRMLRLVPLLVSETNRGDLRMLTYLMDNVQPAPKNQREDAEGAFFAIVCRDQFTTRSPLPAPDTPQGYLGFSIVSFMPEICASTASLMPVSDPPAPLESDVPTLLLTGTFDPMTNDIYARDIEERFSRAIRLTIPDYGHSTLSGYTACQTMVAADFLDTLADPSDAPCLGELSGPEFILSLEQAMAEMMPR